MIRKAAGLLVTLCLAGPAGALPPPPSTPEGILSFADTLLRSGESFRAVTEYHRYLHHDPDGPGADRAVEGLGRAYAAAGRWGEATQAFQTLAERRPGVDSDLLLGAALYRAGRYREASARLVGNGAGDEASILGTLSVLRQESQGNPPPGTRADLTEAFARLPRKSPTAAGWLAVVPGAGHLYVRRPRDAAVSFVLNAAFLWGTIESVRREQWALAGVLGAFELGWYSGNVVSAVNAAHKWNRREEGRFFRRWEETAVPQWNLVLAPDLVGGRLAWRW